MSQEFNRRKFLEGTASVERSASRASASADQANHAGSSVSTSRSTLLSTRVVLTTVVAAYG